MNINSQRHEKTLTNSNTKLKLISHLIGEFLRMIMFLIYFVNFVNFVFFVDEKLFQG